MVEDCLAAGRPGVSSVLAPVLAPCWRWSAARSRRSTDAAHRSRTRRRARRARPAPRVEPNVSPPTKLLGPADHGRDERHAARATRCCARSAQGQVGAVILFAPNIVSRSQLTGADRLAPARRAPRRQPAAADRRPIRRAVRSSDCRTGRRISRRRRSPRTGSTAVASARGPRDRPLPEGPRDQHGPRAGARRADLPGRVHLAAGSSVLVQRRTPSPRTRRAFALGLQTAARRRDRQALPRRRLGGVDTDNKLDELRPTKAQLHGRADALPSADPARPRRGHALDRRRSRPTTRSGAPTALSRTIVQDCCAAGSDFSGVTITDALGTPTGHDEITAGVLAAEAGADILLYTDSATGELTALKRRCAAAASAAPRRRRRTRRIVALKRRVGWLAERLAQATAASL